MLVNGICPKCKKEFVMSVCVGCLEEKTFPSERDALKYVIDNISVKIQTGGELSMMKSVVTEN